MSLRCAGSQLLQTVPSPLLTGASTVSLSIWVRINSGSNFTDLDGVQLFGDGGGKLAVGLSAVGRLQASWSANDGSVNHASSWSQSLIPGVNYHLAATWQGGAQRYYLNGLLVGSDAQPGVLGKLGDAATYPFRLGSDVAGVDVTLDEPTLWVGYALTAADVGKLRDRVADPSTISPASIALRWTLAGPDGVAAAPGDAGLVDGSTTGLSLTSVVGACPDLPVGGPDVLPAGSRLLGHGRPLGPGDPLQVPRRGDEPAQRDERRPRTTRSSRSSSPASRPAGRSPSASTARRRPRSRRSPARRYRYFQWNKARPTPGTYDLAVDLPHCGALRPQPALRGLRRDEPARHRHPQQRHSGGHAARPIRGPRARACSATRRPDELVSRWAGSPSPPPPWGCG